MAADQTTASAPAESAEELSRLREENLRLRDLLIAKDAELGALKGQVAALEAGAARVLGVVARVRSRVPGVLWRTASRLLGRGGPG